MASTELESTENTEATTEMPKLALDVKVETVSACQRHVIVTIGRADIDRCFKEAYDEVVPKAELPGFRIGKAPRKLIESRFREQVADQVKNRLIVESLQQVTEGDYFSAISEPDFDYKAIDVPAEGDFRYEFDIEVRPDFDTPKWEGLELNRLTHNLTDQDVDRQTAKTLTRFATGEPVDGAAETGDSLELTIKFFDGDKQVSEIVEETVVLRSKLILGDATIEGFGELMAGCKEGDTRETEFTISDSAPNPEFRGKKLRAVIEVVEIRRIQVDELTSTLLDSLGFESPAELRDFVRAELTRQFEYHQYQNYRKQIVPLLTKGADWEMPESLVNRQTMRELQRTQLELQASGFDREQIVRYLNVARQNARASTIESLREHFVLEKIAEELKIEPTAEQYDDEINQLADRSDVSPRRIRARLEKSGQMDALRNQIIEREVINRIVAAAKLSDVEDKSFLSTEESSSVDFLVTGNMVEIPEAKHDNDAPAVPGAPKLPSEKSE